MYKNILSFTDIVVARRVKNAIGKNATIALDEESTFYDVTFASSEPLNRQQSKSIIQMFQPDGIQFNLIKECEED